MPRTLRNSRKRTNHRNESTARVTSNLSPNAPEFIPIANDETAANQRPNLVIQSMTFCGSSSTSNSSGSNSNSNYEVTTTISSIPDVLNNKGQRDLLINLLNESKVDCVICYERAKNIEQIWNCRNCYQIMHLKCIIVWFIKSHCNAVWRCPACQCEMTGKPKYICFCGTLPNPYHNSVDTPHSCGQVCGLQRKNSNLNYNDCHHKCTLLCHPGPCPQCVVQVLRSCGCGKKRVYAQCGQSTQIVCNNVCHKKLNCQIHECEKICHANNCEPCNKGCPQNLNPPEATLVASNASFADAILQYNLLPPDSLVTEDELRMLGLNPEELFEPSNFHDSYYSTSSNYDGDNNMRPSNALFDNTDESEVDDDYDVEVDDIDDIMQDIDFGYRSNSNFPVVLANPLSGYSGSHEFEIEYPVTDDDDDEDEDDDDDDEEDEDNDTGGEEEDNDEDNEGSVLNSYNLHRIDNWTDSSSDSSSEEEREIVHDSTPQAFMNSQDSDQSDAWNMSGDDIIDVGAVTGSSYSEESTDSSQSVNSIVNDSNSSDSTSSSRSSSSSSSF